MSAKKNPFLIGFGAVMVLGVGALGYLTYSAADEHSKAREEYESANAELSRLQGLPQFPNDENLKKFLEQKKALQAKVDVLQKDLSQNKIKVEPISPAEFQIKLRDAVKRVVDRKEGSAVELPDKFYLGFDKYQTEPATPTSAPVLNRELKAIESVMNIIMDTKNVKVKELTRKELDEEKPNKPAPPPQPGQKGKRDAGESGRKVAEKNAFTIKFLASNENARRILNGIVTSKEQLFVPRYFAAVNEKVEAPPKVAIVITPPPPPPDAVAANAAAPAATGANPTVPPGPTAAQQPQSEYVFGRELVEVTMDIELVDVAEVATSSPDKKTVKAN